MSVIDRGSKARRAGGEALIRSLYEERGRSLLVYATGDAGLRRGRGRSCWMPWITWFHNRDLLGAYPLDVLHRDQAEPLGPAIKA